MSINAVRYVQSYPYFFMNDYHCFISPCFSIITKKTDCFPALRLRGCRSRVHEGHVREGSDQGGGKPEAKYMRKIQGYLASILQIKPYYYNYMWCVYIRVCVYSVYYVTCTYIYIMYYYTLCVYIYMPPYEISPFPNPWGVE